MDESALRRLYAYTDWANDRILTAVEGLTDEQFTRTIVSSFDSIRATLAHIAFAEWLWLQRWLGINPTERPEWVSEPSFASLRERFAATAAARRDYLDGLRAEQLRANLEYRALNGDPFAVPLGDLLTHCANHSTYHRGQLVTMLRQVGVAPPGTDYVLFVRTAVQ